MLVRRCLVYDIVSDGEERVLVLLKSLGGNLKKRFHSLIQFENIRNEESPLSG